MSGTVSPVDNGMTYEEIWGNNEIDPIRDSLHRIDAAAQQRVWRGTAGCVSPTDFLAVAKQKDDRIKAEVAGMDTSSPEAREGVKKFMREKYSGLEQRKFEEEEAAVREYLLKEK